MAVKADYKNAIFSGSRRYHISENEDGTVSLTDVTQYIQKGDKFGAKDVNGIGDAINGLADSLSDAFSEEKSYKVGEYVIYDNKIYRFTVAKQAGPWEADKVEFAKVAKVVGEIYGNITVLSQKITSFEQTKSEIAASGLGAALGLAASNTWAQIVAKIKSIANRGVLNWSGSNTTFAVPAGYYPGGTLDSRPSYNSGYNAGVTAADNRANVNSVNYKTGYNAGVVAGKNASFNLISSGTMWHDDVSSHQLTYTANTHCVIVIWAVGTSNSTPTVTKNGIAVNLSAGYIRRGQNNAMWFIKLNPNDSILFDFQRTGSGHTTYGGYGVFSN